MRSIDDKTTCKDASGNLVNAAALFDTLKKQWREEKRYSSSSTVIANCPSYKKIIAMGDVALPLILAELEREKDDPDHWFEALNAITGADPIPEEHYGHMAKMAADWLAWAKDHHHVW